MVFGFVVGELFEIQIGIFGEFSVGGDMFYCVEIELVISCDFEFVGFVYLLFEILCYVLLEVVGFFVLELEFENVDEFCVLSQCISFYGIYDFVIEFDVG